MTLRVRVVSDEEREELGRMARSRTVGAGLMRRAQIVLHALEGLKAPEISARMDLCGATVQHWLSPELDERVVEAEQRRRGPRDGLRTTDVGSPRRGAAWPLRTSPQPPSSSSRTCTTRRPDQRFRFSKQAAETDQSEYQRHRGVICDRQCAR